MKKIRSWCFRSTGSEFIKLLRMMKIVFFLMVVCLTHLSAAVRGQNTTVNLELSGAPVSQVINSLEKQLGKDFFYRNEQVDVDRRIDVKLEQANLDEVVRQVFGAGYSWSVIDNMIVISLRKQAAAPKEKTIRGTVRNVKGESMPGVTVMIKGTTLGVTTDIDGRFKLTVPEMKETVLVFSFVGMETKELMWRGEESMNVVMKETVHEIDEVVVTGIFTKAKESYTGAATTITSKDLRTFGNRNVLSTIRNIDPSFNIADNVEFGSDPNRLPDITVRGSSSMDVSMKDLQNDTKTQSKANLPLFVLDGFEVALERVMDIDDNQIETITLLKDASATAMYGTRGANGVVVITTKRPEGGRLQVTYRGNLSLEIPDLTSYDLMNAREKLAYEKASGFYESPKVDYQHDHNLLYNKRLKDVERGVDTYWLKYPVRTGVGHRHSLRLEGGDDVFRYAANVGYNVVTGAMKGSERRTLNGGLFLSYKLKNVTFQNDLSVSYNRAKNSPYGSFSTYAKMNPYWSPYDENGNLLKRLETERYPYIGGDISVRNPLYGALLPSKNQTGYDNVTNNFAIEWKILPDLVVKGRLGITRQTGRGDIYVPAEDATFDNYAEADFDRKGTYTYSTDYMFRYETDITLNYSKTFREKHMLYAGFGYNSGEEKTENYSVQGEGYPNANMDFLGMGSAYQKDGSPAGTEGISRRVGGLANINYTYDRKYFADFSGKVEASSRFGSNSRVAPFWSAGIGWNVHNERFFTDNRFVQTLRLRISYGVNGSQNFDPYQSMRTFKFYDVYYRNQIGAKLIALGNPDLGWQQTGQWNAGLEALLFNGAFRVNVDFYNKLTNDMLADITLPSASGFDTYKANVGKVRNRGVEVTANLYLIRSHERDITWSVGGTLAYNKNTIMHISNSLDFMNDQIIGDSGDEEKLKKNGVNPSFLYREGQSMNTIFAVRSKGIDPANGKEIFIKADGTETYTWDGKDQVACGVAEPKIQGTLNTLFRYRGLSLNVLFGYRYGGQLFNSTLVNRVENVNVRDNADRRVFYDRWKEPGDHTFFKSVKDKTLTKASSRFVQDENTLECRTINVGYDYYGKWVKEHLGLSYLNIGVYAENVFRLSTVKEERGLSYPFARTFSLSLTARF